MTKEKLLYIADKNKRKTKIVYDRNIGRPGITEEEKNNLYDNMEFANIVYNMMLGKIMQ